MFVQELTAVLNKYSQENGSNTPDFILASYLLACLEVFNHAVNRRDEWYGRIINRPALTTQEDPV